jgi:hypothetical protein
MKSYKMILIAALVLLSQSVLAFTTIRTSTGAKVHWIIPPNPIYVVNPSSGNTTTQKCVAAPITTFQNAFSAWDTAVPLAINVTYGGTTHTTEACGFSSGDDGCDSTNVVLFLNSSAFPTGALAVTVNQYSDTTGVITGADVVFNDALSWSDDPTGSLTSGCTGSSVYALSAVATHEFGHFHGLDHSFAAYVGDTIDYAIAPTMFPFYFEACDTIVGDTCTHYTDYWQDQVTLSQDDIAGVYSIYPGDTNPGWGWITGTVKSSYGNAIFGAHVVAIGTADAIPVVDAVTEKDGTYKLFGLPPGNYFVYTESPYIGGELFTYYLSSYYSDAGTVPQPMLYKNIRLTDYAQIDPGATTLTHATPVTVSADTATPNINFSYATIYNTLGGGGGHHHHSSSSCAISRNSENSDISMDPPFILVLFAVFGLAARSIARSKKVRRLVIKEIGAETEKFWLFV